MAQRLIPGGPFVNEVGTAQRLIPGGPFVNETVSVGGGSFNAAWARGRNQILKEGAMKKNVASQKVGAQMVSATDGSAFTGSVTVYVTLDAGTQAVGSVGSGACTHEGNGYHTYAPAQGETNGDLVAFTFIGTGAVPASVQVYTSFPQTGDAYAETQNGTYGLSAIETLVDGLETAATAIEADTQDIQARLPAALVGGRIDANMGAISADSVAADNAEAFFDGTGYAGTGNVIPTVTTLTNLPAITANWLTAAGIAADAGAEIADAVWDEAIAGHAGAGSTGEALAAAGAAGDPWITALPGSYSAGQAGYIVGTNLNATVSSRASQTSLDTVDDFLDTEVAAIKAKTDNLPAAPAAVGDIPTAVQNADALLGRNVSGGSSTGRTVKQAFHFIRNKWVVSGGTLTVYDTDDSTSSWTAAVTGTAGADPVTGSDPA